MFAMKSHYKIVMLITSLFALSANAQTVTFTSYLSSSGWVQTANTDFGDPLFLEAELIGQIAVPLIDPNTYILTSVTMALTMDGGGDTSSSTTTAKYGGFDLSLTSGALPLNFTDNALWPGVGTVGGGVVSHNGTSLSGMNISNFYGTPGSANNLDITLIDFDLLLSVGSDEGDLAYAYLNEAYIDITYDWIDVGGGPNGPNFPTGFGGSGWDIQIQPSGVVPIPTAIWLFGSGLICLIGVARRKVKV